MHKQTSFLTPEPKIPPGEGINARTFMASNTNITSISRLEINLHPYSLSKSAIFEAISKNEAIVALSCSSEPSGHSADAMRQLTSHSAGSRTLSAAHTRGWTAGSSSAARRRAGEGLDEVVAPALVLQQSALFCGRPNDQFVARLARPTSAAAQLDSASIQASAEQECHAVAGSARAVVDPAILGGRGR